jgi:tRNA(Ile)-lysidine synthase
VLRCVVAVSGGEDSHVLLHALRQISESEGLDLVVAHLDHALRQESLNEAQFVEELAAHYGLPVRSHRAEKPLHAENVEAWARGVRYRYLSDMLGELHADVIVTAHHQSDQAETLLLRMLSGRTAASSFSIAELDPARRLWRPLLQVSKAVIAQYAADLTLPFCVDRSNYMLSRTRSRVRHELLPELKQRFNPRISETLATVAERLNEDEAFLNAEAERTALRLANDNLDGLRELPDAIRWRVIRVLCRNAVGAVAERVSFAMLRKLSAEVCSDLSGGCHRFSLGKGIVCELDQSHGMAFSLLEIVEGTEEVEVAARLFVPGLVKRDYSDGSAAVVQARILEASELAPARALELVHEGTCNPEQSARAFFDVTAIDCARLLVRERRDGDRVRVWGRGGRKLKKLLQERGLKLTLRDRLPIVELGGEILWVPGVARSELAPVAQTSNQLLELTYFRS